MYGVGRCLSLLALFLLLLLTLLICCNLFDTFARDIFYRDRTSLQQLGRFVVLDAHDAAALGTKHLVLV